MPTIGVGLITEASQAETIVSSGQADMVALARAMLYDPRWPWHAAAELGAQVSAPPQYWRSQPHEFKTLFGPTTAGPALTCICAKAARAGRRLAQFGMLFLQLVASGARQGSGLARVPASGSTPVHLQEKVLHALTGFHLLPGTARRVRHDRRQRR